MSFSDRINQRLEQRKADGLERRLLPLNGGNRAEFELSTESFTNFSSNDYLGLASSSELVKHWQKGLDLYGSGSGASPLVTGFSTAHQQLEQTLCQWLGYDRAVLFGSGFSANQAVIFTLLSKHDHLIQDKLNHASLMEAGMLSSAQMKRFRHNDIDHLSKIITPCLANKPSKERDNGGSTLVVTEGVFSMDGDCAPLNDIYTRCSNSGSWLMVDDAHGIGVRGSLGAGSCSVANIKPAILVVTFGKAFGLSGAAVMCDSSLGDYLTQFSRHHVYSTAFPPAQAYALTQACYMIQSQQWRRDKLIELGAVYDEVLSDHNGFVQTSTPIKPFICGGAEQATKLAEKLKQHGFWVTAIRPPTVAKQTSRIRVTLTANHNVEQVSNLAKVIASLNSSHYQ